MDREQIRVGGRTVHSTCCAEPAAIAFPSVTPLKVLAGPARFNLAEGTLKTLTVNKNKERVIFFKRLQLHLLIGFTHSNPLHPRPPPYHDETLSLSSQLEQLFGLESSREQKANDQSGGFIGFMRYPWLAERIRHQKVEQQHWDGCRNGGRGVTGHGQRVMLALWVMVVVVAPGSARSLAGYNKHLTPCSPLNENLSQAQADKWTNGWTGRGTEPVMSPT